MRGVSHFHPKVFKNNRKKSRNNNNNKCLYLSSQRYNGKVYSRKNKKAIKNLKERKIKTKQKTNKRKKNSIKVKIDINKDRKNLHNYSQHMEKI
jgi:hypothetical protein